jgi:hypothetical protein
MNCCSEFTGKTNDKKFLQEKFKKLLLQLRTNFLEQMQFEQKLLRPILNFAPGGKLHPRCKVVPQG